jgi:hypothetical protein
MKITPIIDQEIFNKNLLLTQAYCEMQLENAEKSPAEILRSFNPEYEGEPIFTFVEGQYSPPFYQSADWLIDSLDIGNEYLYTNIFDKQLNNKRSFDYPSTGTFIGKILITEIDRVIWDGAAEQESEGFIDSKDCPPIDTWFYIEKYNNDRLLYSWIPDRFVKSVGNAMEVSMLGPFCWMEDFSYTDYNGIVDISKSSGYQYKAVKKSIPAYLLILIIILISIIVWLFFSK